MEDCFNQIMRYQNMVNAQKEHPDREFERLYLKIKSRFLQDLSKSGLEIRKIQSEVPSNQD